MDKQLELQRRRLSNHPLIAKSVGIATNPISELYEAIQLNVALKDSGLFLDGESGEGKSTAISVLAEELRCDFPGLPVFIHSLLNNQVPSIRAFFKHFLTSVSCKHLKGDGYDLRLRLVNRLIDDARRSDWGMIVIFIDEAQQISTQDLCFLKDVYNSLSQENTQLVTILFGQRPQLGGRLREIAEEDRYDLIRRFARRPLTLRSYSQLADIAQICAAVDETVDAEGVTWTQFFYPKAYASGFRLTSEASNFYNSLCTCTHDGTQEGFSARQVFETLRHFLTTTAGYDAPTIQFPQNAWAVSSEHGSVPGP